MPFTGDDIECVVCKARPTTSLITIVAVYVNQQATFPSLHFTAPLDKPNASFFSAGYVKVVRFRARAVESFSSFLFLNTVARLLFLYI